MRSARLALLPCLTVLWVGCHRSPARPEALTLATTTSTQDSGLLDVLMPLFRQQTGIEVAFSETRQTNRNDHMMALRRDVDDRGAPSCNATFAVFVDGNPAHPLDGGCGWTRYLATAPLLSAASSRWPPAWPSSRPWRCPQATGSRPGPRAA